MSPLRKCPQCKRLVGWSENGLRTHWKPFEIMREDAPPCPGCLPIEVDCVCSEDE